MRRTGDCFMASWPAAHWPNGRTHVRPNAADRLQAGIEEDGEQRQRPADHDAGTGVEAEQRDDVDGEREEQRAEQRADERTAAAGERRAAEHGRRDAGQRVARADDRGADADLGAEKETAENRDDGRQQDRRACGRSRCGRRCASPPPRGSRRRAA